MHSLPLSKVAVFGAASKSLVVGRLLHSSQKGSAMKVHYAMTKPRRVSIFSDVPPPSNYAVFDVPSDAINLSVEAYRDERGKPWPLPIVRKIEKQLANDSTLDHDYLDNSTGFQGFIELSSRLVVGPDYDKIKENIVAIQTVSSTGALRLGFEFMLRVLGCKDVLVSNPTYADYGLIANNVGFKSLIEYPYYDYQNRSLAFEPMLHALEQAHSDSVIVLQLGHNPTGLDPSIGQWRQISAVIKDKNLIPFFDVANTGLCSGSVDEDSYPLRVFMEMGIEFFVAQSFSKNFGLYDERVGNLIVFTHDASKRQDIEQYLRGIARTLWTNPPIHGARVVTRILQAHYYKQEWAVEVQRMYKRTRKTREKLRSKLQEKGTPGTWNHLTDSSGLYTILGLNEHQLNYMAKKHNVYTGPYGRLNVTMLNDENIEKIINAIDDAAKNS